MEALKEIIEIFKEFDGNNVWIVIGISAVLLFIAAGYIQLLNASKIEAILMDQKEESKRRIKEIWIYISNSICSILHQFIEDCEEELHFETPERLLKSLQREIRNRLMAGDEE